MLIRELQPNESGVLRDFLYEAIFLPEGTEPPPGTTIVGRSRVMDFAPIYLDDHAAEMKLVRELRTRVCKQCGREEETTWAGADFFCSECRGKHHRKD